MPRLVLTEWRSVFKAPQHQELRRTRTTIKWTAEIALGLKAQVRPKSNYQDPSPGPGRGHGSARLGAHAHIDEIRPQLMPDDSTDSRWQKFKGYLGALDGTYIDVQVPITKKTRYRNRKGQESRMRRVDSSSVALSHLNPRPSQHQQDDAAVCSLADRLRRRSSSLISGSEAQDQDQ
ncbi:hypothetical protein ACS0TY_020868 [Phlomoides rotata]